MTEAEKTLRSAIDELFGSSGAREHERAYAAVGIELVLLLSEHRAEVAATRDAALEEAEARIKKRCCTEMQAHGFCGHQPCDYYQNALGEIRDLRRNGSTSTPAQVVPVARVKDALFEAGCDAGREEMRALSRVARSLGLSLGVSLDDREGGE